MKKQSCFAVLVLCLLLPILAFAETEYTHGHGALQIFDEAGWEATPQWVKIWIGFMAATFIAGIAFVKNHIIARWVIGGFVLGIICGELFAKLLGIPPLSGYIALIHVIFWSPALYQLLTKRPFLGSRSTFTIWSGVMTFVILFSFIFDIRDAFLFLRHVMGA